MNHPTVERDELMALVDKRKDQIRRYLGWARQNDNEKDSYRMADRDDIKEAKRAAELFPEPWWGVVVFTCFGSLTGAEAVARDFRQAIEPREARSTLARTSFPPGSVGHHRKRPALKGAKEALISACAQHRVLHDLLNSREDFDARYRRLRDEKIRQWGRTTSLDLLLRAGALGICGQIYKPEYAYLKDSTGPADGFAQVWGIRPTRKKDVTWAEALLRAWMDNWEAVGKLVGVRWDKPPLEPCDQENFLCIYHQRRDERESSGTTGCARAEPRDPNLRRVC
jgi:hypothetical protein